MTRFIQQQIPPMPTRQVPEAPCPACGPVSKKQIGRINPIIQKNLNTKKKKK